MADLRLKELRIKRNLSQAQLAEALHAGQTTISKWEKGERRPDPESLIKMATFFECSVDYLIGASETNDPEAAIRKERVKRLNALFAQMDEEEQALLLAIAAKMKR